MMGTPAYMPPEQVTGQDVDGRSDLYAVGVVLYRMLSGTVPFTADSLVGVMQKQIAEDPAPLAAHRAGLPDWCEPLVRRAMAKAASDRFQTAADFAAAIRAAGAVMKPPVGVAHADPVANAAAVERRESRTQTMPVQPTLAIGPKTVKTPSPLDSNPVARGSTVVLSSTKLAQSHWQPIAITVVIGILATLAVWRFAGGSLQPTATTTRVAERPAPTPPPAQAQTPPATTSAAPSATGRAAPTGPIVRATPKTSPPSGTRGTIIQAQPPLASIPIPAHPASLPPGTAPEAAVEKPSSKPTATPVVFEAKFLVRDPDGAHERDSRIVLADGKIHVQATDETKMLYAVPYDDVLSIAYSRGRDPLWNAPGGPEPVARAGGGPLGIFRGTRHWISLRTTNARNRFVVLRLGSDVQAKRAIAALEERTGRRAQVVGSVDGR
jgi:serine/threonine-protein kinase